MAPVRFPENGRCRRCFYCRCCCSFLLTNTHTDPLGAPQPLASLSSLEARARAARAWCARDLDIARESFGGLEILPAARQSRARTSGRPSARATNAHAVVALAVVVVVVAFGRDLLRCNCGASPLAIIPSDWQNGSEPWRGPRETEREAGKDVYSCWPTSHLCNGRSNSPQISSPSKRHKLDWLCFDTLRRVRS